MEPDFDSALYAVNAASEMLNEAADKLSQKDYASAFSASRDCMRIAASALLFRDGVIASTLEATTEYIQKIYPDKLPLKEWGNIEKVQTGEGPGIFNLIVKTVNKPLGESEAERALDIAARFIDTVKELVLL